MIFLHIYLVKMSLLFAKNYLDGFDLLKFVLCYENHLEIPIQVFLDTSRSYRRNVKALKMAFPEKHYVRHFTL